MRPNETEALLNWVNNISFVIKSKCPTLNYEWILIIWSRNILFTLRFYI